VVVCKINTKINTNNVDDKMPFQTPDNDIQKIQFKQSHRNQ